MLWYMEVMNSKKKFFFQKPSLCGFDSINKWFSCHFIDPIRLNNVCCRQTHISTIRIRLFVYIHMDADSELIEWEPLSDSISWLSNLLKTMKIIKKTSHHIRWTRFELMHRPFLFFFAKTMLKMIFEMHNFVTSESKFKRFTSNVRICKRIDFQLQ